VNDRMDYRDQCFGRGSLFTVSPIAPEDNIDDTQVVGDSDLEMAVG